MVQRAGGLLVVVMGLALLGVVRGPLAAEHRLLRGVPRVAGPLRPFVVGIVGGVLLVGLGVLLLTGAYQHLTSYLARFTPSVGGL